MATETLEDKKSEEGALVKDKEELKPEGKKERSEETKKEEEQENKEAPEKDVSRGNHELEEKVVDEEEEEKKEEEAKEEEEKVEEAKEEEEQVEKAKEEVSEEEEQDEEGGETIKKAKGGGPRSASKKVKSESKKRSRESSEKKRSKEPAEKKEPVTPSSDRPTRERKTVERYSAPEPGRSATKPLSIEKGRGTQLKDIPNVAFKLSKRKPDDNLQMLHMILFGKKAKAHNLKKNISQFSGYVWAENEEKQKAKIREKLDKCVKEKLVDFCDVLNIPISRAVVKKEELTVKLLEFLESPHVTTDVLLADKEQKGKKRRVSTSKNASSGEALATPAKKQKQTSQVGEKQKHSSKVDADEDEDKSDSPDAKDAKDDLQEEEEEEDAAAADDEKENMPREESDCEESKSEEEEDKPKDHTTQKASKKNVKESSGAKDKDKFVPAKKGTPAKPAKSTKKSSGLSSKKVARDTDRNSGSLSKSKGSASKKRKVEKENSRDQSPPSKEKGTSKKQSGKLLSKNSVKEQGKGRSSKKAKAEPTKEDMHAVVVDILKEVDFNTATLSDILRQLGTHFDVDLMHRKAEVKDIITEVINNMSDEEDEGEETEDNAEAVDDEDKDADGDDDA